MGRILALDYGTKRVGVAVTDPLQIIATGVATVHSKDVIEWLKDYLKKENVDVIVIGEPKDLKNNPSESEKHISAFINKLKKKIPEAAIARYDERFTSSMAAQSMIESGAKKKDRQKKELTDMISAVLILQSYMERKK
jgi:putative Holliday junction resolvase